MSASETSTSAGTSRYTWSATRSMLRRGRNRAHCKVDDSATQVTIGVLQVDDYRLGGLEAVTDQLGIVEGLWADGVGTRRTTVDNADRRRHRSVGAGVSTPRGGLEGRIRGGVRSGRRALSPRSERNGCNRTNRRTLRAGGGVGDRLHRTWVPTPARLNTGASKPASWARIVERVVFIIRTQPEIDERLLQHGHDCPP